MNAQEVVVMEGMLRKLPVKHGVPSCLRFLRWRRRYHQLFSDGQLRWYRRRADVGGEVYRSEQITPNSSVGTDPDRPNSFSVSLTGGHIFIGKAIRGQREAQEWINAFKSTITGLSPKKAATQDADTDAIDTQTRRITLGQVAPDPFASSGIIGPDSLASPNTIAATSSDSLAFSGTIDDTTSKSLPSGTIKTTSSPDPLALGVTIDMAEAELLDDEKKFGSHDQQTWRCGLCKSLNPLAIDECDMCNTPRAWDDTSPACFIAPPLPDVPESDDTDSGDIGTPPLQPVTMYRQVSEFTEQDVSNLSRRLESATKTRRNSFTVEDFESLLQGKNTDVFTPADLRAYLLSNYIDDDRDGRVSHAELINFRQREKRDSTFLSRSKHSRQLSRKLATSGTPENVNYIKLKAFWMSWIDYKLQEKRQCQKELTDACIEDFELLEVLGKGATAELLRMQNTKGLRKQYAVKKMWDYSGDTEWLIKTWHKDFEIPIKHPHPYLITIYNMISAGKTVHVTDTEKYAGTGVTCYVFMDLAKADLKRVVQDRRAKGEELGEKEILVWLLQIAIVLDHLNQRNLVHRDLKLNNVVVMGEGVDEGEIRLIDFGCAGPTSCPVDELQGNPMNQPPEVVGMARWYAKELARKKSPKAVKVRMVDHSKHDVWSLGCLVYEFLDLPHPFYGKSIDSFTGPPKLPAQFTCLQKFVDRVLILDPQARPTLHEVTTLLRQMIWDMPNTHEGFLQFLYEKCSELVERFERDGRLHSMCESPATTPWTGGVREKLEVELVMQAILKELGRSLVWEDDDQSESKSLSAASASDLSGASASDQHTGTAAGVSTVSMDDFEDTNSFQSLEGTDNSLNGGA